MKKISTLACMAVLSVNSYASSIQEEFAPRLGAYYRIINEESKKVLNVHDADEGGYRAILNVDAQVDDGTYQGHRLFTFIPQGSGWYLIINRESRKAIHVANADQSQFKAELNVEAWPNDGCDKGKRLFKFNPQGHGWYTIENQESKKVLNVHDAYKRDETKQLNVDAQINDGKWEGHRNFKFERKNSYASSIQEEFAPRLGAYYRIINEESKKVLNVHDADEGGYRAILNVDAQVDDGTYQGHRLFTFISKGFGWYLILNKESGKAIHVANADQSEFKAELNVEAWPNDGCDIGKRLFKFNPQGNGWYTIENKESKKVLNVHDAYEREKIDQLNVDAQINDGRWEGHRKFKFEIKQ